MILKNDGRLNRKIALEESKCSVKNYFHKDLFYWYFFPQIVKILIIPILHRKL